MFSHFDIKDKTELIKIFIRLSNGDILKKIYEYIETINVYTQKTKKFYMFDLDDLNNSQLEELFNLIIKL